jgi:hypothetical protein
MTPSSHSTKRQLAATCSLVIRNFIVFPLKTSSGQQFVVARRLRHKPRPAATCWLTANPLLHRLRRSGTRPGFRYTEPARRQAQGLEIPAGRPGIARRSATAPAGGGGVRHLSARPSARRWSAVHGQLVNRPLHVVRAWLLWRSQVSQLSECFLCVARSPASASCS